MGQTTITLHPGLLARLKAAKPPGATYGELLALFLARVSPEEARFALEARRDVARGEARERRAALAGAPGTRRDPSEQRALAAAAEARFAEWVATRALVLESPRRYRVNALRGGDSRVVVKRRPRAR